MSSRRLLNDENATDKVIVIALVSLLTVSVVSVIAYVGLEDESTEGGSEVAWIDPVVEIEDENHSHSDLLATDCKRTTCSSSTTHNLNCDGNVAPPAELDNVAGRPCSRIQERWTNPGIRQRFPLREFLEDCEKKPTEREGATLTFRPTISLRFLIFRAKQHRPSFHVLCEIGRMIDIKVTLDNNWVLVNHELTNSDLDPIPQDDDANSGPTAWMSSMSPTRTTPSKSPNGTTRLLGSTIKIST